MSAQLYDNHATELLADVAAIVADGVDVRQRITHRVDKDLAHLISLWAMSVSLNIPAGLHAKAFAKWEDAVSTATAMADEFQPPSPPPAELFARADSIVDLIADAAVCVHADLQGKNGEQQFIALRNDLGVLVCELLHECDARPADHAVLVEHEN